MKNQSVQLSSITSGNRLYLRNKPALTFLFILVIFIAGYSQNVFAQSEASQIITADIIQSAGVETLVLVVTDTTGITNLKIKIGEDDTAFNIYDNSLTLNNTGTYWAQGSADANTYSYILGTVLSTGNTYFCRIQLTRSDNSITLFDFIKTL